ncbi:ABC transporter permease subunit [Gymnodinialimonas sp. 57CJ19]|uniref:ABC transporter permease n=1 Tax=Gymnodinialimonas sp. 57CJ19 TaxID=3138498 RepID=UPI00313422CC
MVISAPTGVEAQASTPRQVSVLELRGRLGLGGTIVSRVVAFIVFALLWEVSAKAADSILIPTFTETLAALYETMFLTGEIWPALWVSNIPLIMGYAIAIAISVPLGLMMARWKTVDRALSPITALALALPISPLIPIVLVALGFGLAPKVVIIVLFSWVFITTNVRAGARMVDKSLVEMARSLGASERQVWFRILIPGAIPAVFAGLRIGLGRAFAGMVIVELIMLPVGIGALLLDYRGDFEAALLYATTILVVIEAVALAILMQALERHLIRWK